MAETVTQRTYAWLTVLFVAMPDRDNQRFEFRLLGPLEVIGEGIALEIAGSRQRALAAILLLHANQVVARERLIAGIWGEDPPPTAANALQVAIHALRKSLAASRIETRGSGYVLHLRAGELDLDRFQTLVARARRESGGAAARTLRRALALWRGAALVDFSDFPYLATEARRLEGLRLAAVEQRIDADLARGRHADLVGELEALVAANPLRERLHGQLMLALYRSGRQAEALEAYQRTRSTLVDELGIDPSDELRELQLRIIRQDPSVGRPTTQRVASLGGLPAPATALVGRDRELAALTALVLREDVRLVTMTGAGGIGKSRLALAAAANLVDEFTDGVFFVDLASVRQPDFIPSAIATAIGLPEQPSHPIEQTVGDWLRTRELLLFLDNFEHLADSAAVVAGLLVSAPGLAALVTSRVRLRVAAEHVFPIPPLGLPKSTALDVGSLADSDAVRLFVARAEAVVPDFRLTVANAGAVAGLCRAVDGLPLAIELVAARSTVFAPEAMLARFGLHPDLVTTGTRDGPARHQTLRAMVDWSYELLTPDQQDFFRRLGVLAGGGDLEAVTAVTASWMRTVVNPVDLVAELVDASLATITDAPDREPRVSMLRTIRSYAHDRLTATAERDMVRQAHAHHFLGVATALAELAHSSRYLEARSRLDVEYENLREALGWALQPDPTGEHQDQRVSLGLQLCNALTWFWSRSGYLAEGRRWLERAVALAGDTNTAELAASLGGLAGLLTTQGHHSEARDLAAASVETWRSLRDSDSLAKALSTLAIAEYDRGDIDPARAHFEEAVEVARAATNPTRLSTALGNLSSIEVAQRNFHRAEELLHEALDIERKLGDVWGVTLDEHNMAWLLLAMRRIPEAHTCIRNLVGDVLTVNDPELTISLAEAYAAVLAEIGDTECAARLLGAADASRDTNGIPRSTQQESELQLSMVTTRAAVPAEEWDRDYTLGRGTTVEESLIDARDWAAEPGTG